MEKLAQSVNSYSRYRVSNMDKTVLVRMEAVRRWTGGILFVFALFITALFGFVCLSPVYVIGFAFKCHSAQWIYDTLMSTWFAFAAGAYELIYGVKIVVQGDVTKMNRNRCSLVVMNHRTRLDWLFYFAVQARYASLRRFKISLKNEIRHIPGAGWAMQGAQFLFLKRRWNIDRGHITKVLDHFENTGYHPQLLLFPEGTDMHPLSRQRSKDYAQKNELDDYEYVLHPRTLGFTSVVSYMKQHNQLDQIIDVTVSYPENILQNETDLFTGNIPRVVVFTIECFDIEALPSDNEALMARWIEERWELKEAFLRDFYTYRDYTNKNGYSVNQNKEIQRELVVNYIGALLFWLVLTVVSWYGLMYYWLFAWVFGWSVLACIALSTIVGFEHIFIKAATCPTPVQPSK